jgi:hypothetical protein
MASQLKRLEAAEMRLLRPLAGPTLLDHKRNEDIRKKLNTENITSMTLTFISLLFRFYKLDMTPWSHVHI